MITKKERITPLVVNGKIVPHQYMAVDGGREPQFSKCTHGGRILYAHQSGYGSLPEDRVEIVPAASTIPSIK